MKKAEIEIGKEYAYQRNRNDEDKTYGIERATVTGFTSSYNGAPMVQIEVHRLRWEYDYTNDWKKVQGSERQVNYKDTKKVTLSTIVGEYEAEKARRDALAIKFTQEQEENRRLKAIRDQWKAENYEPAMAELIAELSHITQKGYVHSGTKLSEFDLEQIKAITEALRKVSVTA